MCILQTQYCYVLCVKIFPAKKILGLLIFFKKKPQTSKLNSPQTFPAMLHIYIKEACFMASSKLYLMFHKPNCIKKYGSTSYFIRITQVLQWPPILSQRYILILPHFNYWQFVKCKHTCIYLSYWKLFMH